MIKVLFAVVLILIIGFVAFTYWVSRPAFDEERDAFKPTIADPDAALTFARSAAGLIWVTEHKGDAIVGTNLTKLFGKDATSDLISFVHQLDEVSLPEPDAAPETFSLSELQSPLAYTHPAIAAGTNFKEHADEVYSDDPPFLFPKLSAAGNWDQPVPFTPRLDYEAELCMFPLADITSPDALPGFGLVLCNDFTDRWTLVKELKLREPLGKTGFASGKGKPGYLPTGYLVVIPRAPDYYLSLDMSLYVNDTLRQRFSMHDVILKIEEIVTLAFERKTDQYQKADETVSLMPHANIPRGTLLLTGTAAGVIFKPLNIWNQSFYLKQGDTVRVEGTGLGHLNNTVIAPEM